MFFILYSSCISSISFFFFLLLLPISFSFSVAFWFFSRHLPLFLPSLVNKVVLVDVSNTPKPGDALSRDSTTKIDVTSVPHTVSFEFGGRGFCPSSSQKFSVKMFPNRWLYFYAKLVKFFFTSIKEN
uniref:Uncharacterized protein n=1 Tax=Cacopsylla melanoneura TaxID=428564 RepID=A0A8D8W354_9HEMI